MVHFYFDTSALIKRYHKENGSEAVDRIFDSEEEKGFVTSYWTVLEFMTALASKEKRKELSKRGLGVAIANLVKDLNERFAIRSVNDELVAKALPLGVKYGPLGASDCLHLATALELKQIIEEAAGRLVFVSADEDLCKAVRKEKMEVINPRDNDALKQVEKLLVG